MVHRPARSQDHVWGGPTYDKNTIDKGGESVSEKLKISGGGGGHPGYAPAHRIHAAVVCRVMVLSVRERIKAFVAHSGEAAL